MTIKLNNKYNDKINLHLKKKTKCNDKINYYIFVMYGRLCLYSWRHKYCVSFASSQTQCE